MMVALPTTEGQTVAEGKRVEQQVIKATTSDNVTSTCHTNSQQFTWSQPESTHSATLGRRKHDEAGTS